MTESDSRKAFEEWATLKWWFNETPASDGKYYDNETQAAYEAWQASERRLLDMLESEEMAENVTITVCRSLNEALDKNIPKSRIFYAEIVDAALAAIRKKAGGV